MLGVKIGNKHTWTNWKLPWLGVELSAPQTKSCFIDIPGRDGALDLTEALTGFPSYNNRNLSLFFDTKSKSYDTWLRIYSDILNECHGQRLKISLDTDPDFYYIGRISVSSEKDVPETDTLTISAAVDPYKYEISSGIEPWHWDSFNFETGIVREYADLIVEGTLSLSIPGRTMRVIPIITCSAAMTVKYNDVTYNLYAGKNKITDLCLGAGENVILFSGAGIVSVNYRGGML